MASEVKKKGEHIYLQPLLFDQIICRFHFKQKRKKELSEECCSHSNNTNVLDCWFYQTDKKKSMAL